MRDVITSSNTRNAPTSCAASRRACRKAGVAGMQPPPPTIGSSTTAASVSAWAWMAATAPSASLKSKNATGKGTVTAAGPASGNVSTLPW